MKKLNLFLGLFLLGMITSGFSQSKSYQALKNNFIDQPDVHSFSFSGFLSRMALGMAGEWEFKEAIKDIKHIRLITIPAQEFKAQDLTVKGFKNLLLADSFDELANIRDNGDDVTFFLQASSQNANRYIVVVEEPDEVIVIEMKGSIDVGLLMSKDGVLSQMKK